MAMTIEDSFRGDDAKLISCIESLITLNDAGALVPHGIGGHARTLLSSAAARLQAHLTQPAHAVDERTIVEAAQQHGMTIELGATYSLRGQIGQLINMVRALAGEKVDGWRGLTDEEKGTLVGQICEFGTGFVSPLFSVIERTEAMLRERNLPTPPTDGEE